jgi:hypothetical protein
VLDDQPQADYQSASEETMKQNLIFFDVQTAANACTASMANQQRRSEERHGLQRADQIRNPDR